MRRLLAALGLAVLLALPALAQAPATLVADSVSIDGNRRLVAAGNVEVLYEGRRLTASRIVYDRGADALTLDGPVTLTDGAGNVLIADSASLSADLTEGLLRSARLVLDRQLQMAANEIARIGGRYTRLSRAVASSCRVCETGETPLWEIRARRVVHDEVERQLYFDDAQFRLAGLPVFWLPRLRMPDPTLTRATGFLMPRLLSTSAVGTGIEVPYFIRLGPSRDVTLIPFASTAGSASLGFRYRQAFRTGRLTFEGAGTTDRLAPGLRGHLAMTGDFALPRDTRLRFRLEGVSDRTYLSDYGISGKDRLESRIEIERVRRDRLAAARITLFSSLRPGEDNATLPALAADAVLRRRIDGDALRAGIGGRFDVAADLHTHFRASGADAVGRDVIRLGLRADWRRDWRLAGGVIVTAGAGLAGDVYRVMQDSAYPAPVTLLTPSASVTLRWPLARTSASGAREVLEPVAQLAWTGTAAAGQVPNEDSILVAFDEGNLLALSRFPGADRREGGTRVNLGLQWTREAPTGWSMGALAGRIIRLDGAGPFTAASGLGGSVSDWLVSGWLHGPDGL
ncbi:MAG: LPS-assembly protein LptD, partial [Gemmobacter sp.]